MSNLNLIIKVNPEKVNDLANSYLLLEKKEDFAEQITPRVMASTEATFRAFLWASAICHSTKGGLKGNFDGKLIKGWDYLLRAFCSAAETNDELVSPNFIKTISSTELVNLLKVYFTDPQITLPDLDRRAELLNKCAHQLILLFFGNVSELLKRADNKVGGDTGAYAQLDIIEAFNDPLRKKSSAFLMTLHFSNLWEITDHENVIPMIDYHRMRLLCRTGCITIDNSDLLDALITQKPVSQDVEEAIRNASINVCIDIANKIKVSMFEFDVILWAHSRSCCRHHPLCVSGQIENDTFYNYIYDKVNGICVFQTWCSGYRDESIRRIWEPFVHTEYY